MSRGTILAIHDDGCRRYAPLQHTRSICLHANHRMTLYLGYIRASKGHTCPLLLMHPHSHIRYPSECHGEWRSGRFASSLAFTALYASGILNGTTAADGDLTGGVLVENVSASAVCKSKCSCAASDRLLRRVQHRHRSQ
jgi:hypothetical protein